MSQESRENFLKLVDEVALPCSQCFVKHVPHPFFVLAVAALYGEDSALCLPREDLNGRLCNRHSAVGFFCSLTCRLSVVVRPCRWKRSLGVDGVIGTRSICSLQSSCSRFLDVKSLRSVFSFKVATAGVSVGV